MARADLRLPSNVPGDLFVDSTCIDCATCRQMQPAASEPPERTLDGTEPVALADDLLAIPTPGHTHGHAVLLWKDVLFTGDHLAWSARRGHLVAFRDANWYSWPETIRSMEQLLALDFTRVLPGHGATFTADSPAAMRREVEKCVAWMKTR